MAARENEADRRPVAAPAGSITITPSDTTILSPICSKLWVGDAAAGDKVKVRMLDGSTPTFIFAAGNVILDIQFDMLYSTGTTLTNSNAVGLFNLT
jgi:hypothetical protein